MTGSADAADGIHTLTLGLSVGPVAGISGSVGINAIDRTVTAALANLGAEFTSAQEQPSAAFGAVGVTAKSREAVENLGVVIAGAAGASVGAGVAVARRAGTVSAVDSINKYLLFSGMVVPGSSYWNIAYGRIEQECAQDLEGMQTMRNLASNMIWIAKCINLGKEHNILPPKFETGEKTHFIRKIEQK